MLVYEGHYSLRATGKWVASDISVQVSIINVPACLETQSRGLNTK